MYIVAAINDKISKKGRIYGIYAEKANAEKAAKEYNDSDLCEAFNDPRAVIEGEYAYTVWYDPSKDPYYDGEAYGLYSVSKKFYATLQDAQNACESGCAIEKKQLCECDCDDCNYNDDDMFDF